MLVRTVTYALVAGFLLVGCPRPEPDDDDDAVDDDDSAAIDDDDAAPGCEAAGPPYDLELSGAVNLTITLDELQCSDFGGDSWRMTYTGPPNWVLRLTTGPLIDGEEITQGVAITLLDQDQQEFIYAGVVQQGHVASVTAEGYTGEPPCGTWLTDPLPATGGGGGPVILSPQPIPFRCD